MKNKESWQIREEREQAVEKNRKQAMGGLQVKHSLQEEERKGKSLQEHIGV